MNNINYILPANVDEWYVKGTYHNTYFEIPAIFNDDGVIDEDATHIKVKEFNKKIFFDNLQRDILATKTGKDYFDYKRPLATYVNKELIRCDYDIKDPAAIPLIEELGINLTNSDYTLIGANTRIRPPYSNRTISVYFFKDLPSSLIDQFGVDTSVFQNLYQWYGLKHDMVTNEVQLKIVCAEQDMQGVPAPTLPEGLRFYSRMFTEDKVMTPHVDCYVWAYPDTMIKYCQDHNLLFPAPDSILSNVGLWGVAYDVNTLDIVTVKAYEFKPDGH